MKRDQGTMTHANMPPQPISEDVLREKYLKAGETSAQDVYRRVAQALASARSIGQALLDRGLNAERPVAILSENDLEHALLALGCLYAGVPYCPVSPAYSTVSQDYDKLRHVLTLSQRKLQDASQTGAGADNTADALKALVECGISEAKAQTLLRQVRKHIEHRNLLGVNILGTVNLAQNAHHLVRHLL